MMNNQSSEVSLTAARWLRGGELPHLSPPASRTGDRVRLELHAPPGSDPEAVFADRNREEGWRVTLTETPGTEGRWSAEVLLPAEPTVLYYRFETASGEVVRERRQREGADEPLYGVWEERDFQLAVYDPASPPPGWVAGSVVYQIFPDRFSRGDHTNLLKGSQETYGQPVLHLQWGERPEHPPRGRDFYGGDLRGIVERLDHLEDLGVSCIYLTPVFSSPTNHRYDALDYTEIDPRLGTEKELRELISEAGGRGIRVLLDGVFNHCSRDSLYFREAQRDKASPYYRMFDFERWPEEYVGWAGVKRMPEFVECPETDELFLGPEGVARRWLRTGASGWRTDVTPWMTEGWWRRFRSSVRSEHPEAYLVAEDWGDSTHRLVGDTYDATMNYRFGYAVLGFATGDLSPAELDDRLETLRRDTPPLSFHAQLNLLGSHDTARLLSRVGGDRSRLMLAVALQMAYPGVPMIYYGDEAGIEGEYGEDGRRSYPWNTEDSELWDFYRRAVRTRRESPALSCGDVETVHIGGERAYGLLRRSGKEMVLALFNGGVEPSEIEVTLECAAPGESHDLLKRSPAAQYGDGRVQTTLPALGSGWYRLYS